ncbi:MAG TPA: acyl-CoA dehydrogenase family protein [Dehalococcoidia bacterium]|nr:acyl-CoA dehydrogenase family protein [Dehalococcoidia bacterium]
MGGFPIDRESKRQALLDAVEQARPAVEAGIAEAERQGTLTLRAVEAMQQAGLFRLKLPAELGGADADPCTQMDVIEAVTMVHPSAGWVLMTNSTAIGNAGAFLPDKGIDAVFGQGRIPRAATVGGMSSIIDPVDGGFLLTGRWPFCSGVPHSEWICLGARNVSSPAEAPETRTCFVPTSSVTIHDNWQVSGLKASGSNDVSTDHVFVPEYMTWPRAGRLRGVRRRGGPIFLLGLPGSVSNEHASFALGVARLALETIKDVAKSKRRGRGAAATTLTDRQVFQHFVAESELKLRAVRLVTFEAHERAWQTVCAGVSPEPAMEAELRGTAVLCTQVAVEIATQAFRFAGGAALHLEDRLQMCMNDANAGAQHFAVSDVAYENYGQFLLDLPEANAYY